MGSAIPNTDLKLGKSSAFGILRLLINSSSGAIDQHGDCVINTASDFITQYTTRQEYKYVDTPPNHDPEWSEFIHMSE